MWLLEECFHLGFKEFFVVVAEVTIHTVVLIAKNESYSHSNKWP